MHEGEWHQAQMTQQDPSPSGSHAAVKSLSGETVALVRLVQIGFVIPLGCDAAAHTARAYVLSLTHEKKT